MEFEFTPIPKLWLKAIQVPEGPLKGELAMPCPCGRPIDLEGDEDIYLIKYNSGPLAFVHASCVNPRDEDENEYE
jgi:hypothetical protein